MANDSAQRIARAIEVFVRGSCFGRSLTHPYIAERVGPLWAMRDAPRRRASDTYRSEEWVGHRVAPERFDRLVRAGAKHRFGLCAIVGAGEDEAPVRSGFKRLGYRLRATEPLMIHGLSRIPRPQAPVRVVRVTTPELADRLARAAGRRQILSEHFPVPGRPAPALRQYAALDDAGTPVAWGRSIVVAERQATWTSNIHTLPAWRRRGIARALLARMLRDDRAHGAEMAVLLASHTGALLYDAVGYERIGTLLLYSPRRS